MFLLERIIISMRNYNETGTSIITQSGFYKGRSLAGKTHDEP